MQRQCNKNYKSHIIQKGKSIFPFSGQHVSVSIVLDTVFLLRGFWIKTMRMRTQKEKKFNNIIAQLIMIANRRSRRWVLYQFITVSFSGML